MSATCCLSDTSLKLSTFKPLQYTKKFLVLGVPRNWFRCLHKSFEAKVKRVCEKSENVSFCD
jgi:glutathione peroxidase-family protein